MEIVTLQDLEFRSAKTWTTVVTILSLLGSLLGIFVGITSLSAGDYISFVLVIVGIAACWLYFKNIQKINDFENPSYVPFYISFGLFLFNFIRSIVNLSSINFSDNAALNEAALGSVLAVSFVIGLIISLVPMIFYVVAFIKTKKLEQYFDEEGNVLSEE